ncbi:uncharacterized protein LOC110070644 [Pogona vitticeps]
MQALLRHLYLFVLLATGASLECEHCQGSGNVCSGPKEACPADKDICYTGYSEDTLVLPIKEEKKVVQCPACYSWTGECGSDVVNYGTSFVTMKGCTSKAVCETMKTGALAMIIKEVKEMRCTFLECETCKSLGETCTGEMKTCPKGKDTCLTIYTESNRDGPEIQKVERGCGSSYHCTFPPVYFHLGYGKVYRSNWVCCKGEECGKVLVKLPPKAMEYNGKQCPACFAWSETCKAELMNCTGWDTSCFEMITASTANGTHVDQIMMGCTNKFVCATMEIERSDFWLNGDTIQKAKCRSLASRLVSLILPTFSGLFLLKIFL